jgi:hypothetical protein
MAPLRYPLTNGEYPDFAAITLDFTGFKMPGGLEELNYEDGLEPGEVRGNSAQLIGTTVGTYSASADFSCFVPQMQEIRTLLQRRGGLYTARFNITAIVERGSITSTVEILGCRMKKISAAFKSGNEGLMQKAELHVLGIVTDGVLPYPGFKKP